MLSKNVNSRKILLVLSATFVVAAICYYYLIIVVPQKESELNQRGFRILARMDKNIREKRNNILFTLDRIYSRTPGNSVTKEDSFDGLETYDLLDSSTWRKQYKNAQVLPTYDEYTNKWNINFFGDYIPFYVSKGKYESKRRDDILYHYKFDANKFFSDVVQYRKDFFEDYIIIHNKSIIFQTRDFTSGSKGVSVNNILTTDFIKEDTLAGRPYFVFFHPIAGDTDTKFTICGLVPKSTFNRDKHSLDPDQIIWLTLILLFGIVLIPFIKIIMVSPFERIQYSDVIRICLSLIAGAAIVTTAFLTWIVSVAEMNRQRDMLRNVNEKISERVLLELTSITDEIVRQESHLNLDNYQSWIVENIKTDATKNASDIHLCFNDSDAKHHTGTFQFIGNYYDSWAIWLQNCDSYPDLDMNPAEYPSLNPKNKEFRFFTIDKATKTKNNFGFQPITSWGGLRNSVLVSKPASEEARSNVFQGYIHSLTDVQRKKFFQKFNPLIKQQEFRPLWLLALETKLFSLTEVALPSEVQFAVLDANGDVLFHSDSKRNLRENFVEECNNRALVGEAIRSHMDTTLTVQYFGRKHQANFSALGKLPLTVVTLYDSTTHLDSLINETTFTLIMLLALALIIIAIFSLTIILTKRPKLLKRQTVNLKWVRLTTINREACKLLIEILLLFALLGVALSFFLSVRLFLTFTIPVLTIAATASRLYKSNLPRYEKSLYTSFIRTQFQVFLVICLLAQALNFVIALVAEGSTIQIVQIISVGLCSIFFLLFLVYKPDGIPDWHVIDFFKRLPIFFKRLPMRFKKAPPQDKDHPTAAHHAPQSSQPSLLGAGYIVTAIILLIVNISVLPTVIFFYNACVQEFHLVEKRNSLQLAENIQTRQQWLANNFGDFIAEKDKSTTSTIESGIYSLSKRESDFQLVKRKSVDALLAKMNGTENGEQTRSKLTRRLYNQVVNIFNLNWDTREARDMFSHRNSSDDDTHRWVWSSDTSAAYKSWLYNGPSPWYLTYRYPEEFPSTAFGGVVIRLDMFQSFFKSIPFYRWAIFASLALAFLFVVYKVMFFTYKKITLLEYFNEGTISKIQKADKELIKNFLEKNDGSNLIVISLPGTDVVTTLTPRDPDCVRIETDKLSDTDPLKMLSIPHISYAAKGTNKVALTILPFFDISDADNLSETLINLTKLFQDTSIKVIWVTSVDPKEQVEILGKRMIALAAQKDQSAAGKTEISLLRKDRESLLKILDDFRKVNYRFEDNFEDPNTPRLFPHIDEEFRFGAYFRKLRKNVVSSGVINGYYHYAPRPEGPTADGNASFAPAEQAAEPEISKHIDEHSDDLFILKIQDIVQNYYYSIWVTLSNKEKYVLYDLAQDELTNYKNYSTLVDLERKGILYFDCDENSLKIFNKSFRNFILTVVDPDDAMMLKSEINTGGTWDAIRTIMIIFVVAAGIFLFITENWFYNKLLIIGAAVATFAPLVVNFFNSGIKTIWTKKEA